MINIVTAFNFQSILVKRYIYIIFFNSMLEKNKTRGRKVRLVVCTSIGSRKQVTCGSHVTAQGDPNIICM